MRLTSEMRMLDLFSGIGGFALAAQWVWKKELEIVGFCDIEGYSKLFLFKNFPNVPIYHDIKKLKTKELGRVDLITGGFPCQDISITKKDAKGLEGERSSLWFELYRVIRELRPRYTLIENVPMLTNRGGVRVISDLAKIGYDCEWTIISAREMGAWHLRKRIWIVAYPKEELSYAKSIGWTERSNENDNTSKVQQEKRLADLTYNSSSTGRGADLIKGWKSEPGMGRVVDGVSSGVDRLKGLGNAIVPQVAYTILKGIKDYEENKKSTKNRT